MLLSGCKQYFHTDSLYDVLLVDKSATASEIKKGYYRQSLKWHPDKATYTGESSEITTVKFQIITRAYEILSDKEKRTLYDESGVIDEENLSFGEDISVWLRAFKKVTLEDIEKFCAEYKGSEEEEKDVLTAYNKWDGDMSKIMESIIGLEFDEETRIKEIIERNIASGLLKKTAKYKSSTSKVASTKRKRKGMKEAKEAEETLKKIKIKEGAGSLDETIQRRQLARFSNVDSFIHSLELKYGTKNKRAK